MAQLKVRHTTKAAKKTTGARAKRIAKSAAKRAVRTVKLRRMNRAEAVRERMRALSESHPDESFWINNGPVVNSVGALRNAILHMSDEQFAYHTVRDGNDFANWLRHALKHEHCACKIETTTTRAGALRALATCTCE